MRGPSALRVPRRRAVVVGHDPPAQLVAQFGRGRLTGSKSRLTVRDLLRRKVCQQREIHPHHIVGATKFLDDLAQHLFGGGSLIADVVAEALRHLLDAVEALEQRRRHDDLRLAGRRPA